MDYEEEQFSEEPHSTRGPLGAVAGWLKAHPLLVAAPLLLLALAYAGLWVMTSRIQKQVVEYLAGALGADVAVDHVKVTPALRINLDGVTVTSRESELGLPDLTVEKVMLAADVPSLFAGKVKLSEVYMLGAEIKVYQEPDGTYNITRWLDRSDGCDATAALRAMPGRINMRDSRVTMEPPPGAHWTDTMELATLDGAIGKTREGRIGMEMTAVSFNSSVALKGAMAPCDPRSITVKGISGMFDFSALRSVAEDILYGGEKELNLPGGSGKLSFAMEGSILNPYFVGEVSLQDFDASFSYAEKTLNVSDFKSGMGREKISGSGAMHFHAEGIPFDFTMLLEGIDLRKTLRRLGGMEYPPEGSLSGVLKINGNLDDGSFSIDSGNITVTDGAFVFPDPGLSSSASRPGKAKTARIRFDQLTSKVYTSKNSLRFAGMAISAENWKGGGAGWIDESFITGGLSDGTGYYLELTMESGDLAPVLADFPSFRGKVGGVLQANLSISGKAGDTESLHGSGNVKLLDGFLGNPYQGTSTYSYQTIDFDLANAAFSIGPYRMRFSNATVSADGVDIEAEGSIAYSGELDISAEAVLAPERARDFEGLARFVAGRDMFTMATYSAKCSVKGDIHNPESTWTKPDVIRWSR